MAALFSGKFIEAEQRHKSGQSGLEMPANARIGFGLATLIACPGVGLNSATRVANRNYLFLDLKLGADLAPGSCRGGSSILEIGSNQNKSAGRRDVAG